MLGCIRWLIVLTVVVILLGAGWVLRDRWLERPGDRGAATAGPEWKPLSPEAAARARAAVQRLSADRGPVFETLDAADVSSFIFEALTTQLPQSAEDVHAAVIDDRMYVMATVRLSELGGATVLGPLASMFSERDTVRFGGAFEMVRPGLAQFRVQEIRVRDFPVPARLIPRLLQQMRRGARPEGLADDGLALTVPPHIGDVRIANGKVTMYKNVP